MDIQYLHVWCVEYPIQCAWELHKVKKRFETEKLTLEFMDNYTKSRNSFFYPKAELFGCKI